MILATFLILALVFTFFELLTDIVRNKVPRDHAGRVPVNLSPSLLYLMAPMAVLLAVLITFGLLEKSSELTAMKATGISIYRAALPVIVLCAIFAAACSSSISSTSRTPTGSRKSCATRSRANRRRPTCRLTASGFSDRTTRFTTTRCSIPTPTSFGGISIFEFDPNTFQLTRRIYADHAHWDERPEASGSSSRAGCALCTGTSIQDYRTFDVATFNELHEDPSYFKKEVKQSVGDELSTSCGATSTTCSRVALTPCG